jgi:hypothetical protein
LEHVIVSDGEMVAFAVRPFEYSDTQLHPKMMTLDGVMGVIGSSDSMTDVMQAVLVAFAPAGCARARGT